VGDKGPGELPGGTLAVRLRFAERSRRRAAYVGGRWERAVGRARARAFFGPRLGRRRSKHRFRCIRFRHRAAQADGHIF